MLTLIISCFYLLLLFIFVTISFFIVYHVAKYSINSTMKVTVLPIFVIITTLLIISNALLFLTIDWNTILSDFLMS
jgi:hypothetical protein